MIEYCKVIGNKILEHDIKQLPEKFEPGVRYLPETVTSREPLPYEIKTGSVSTVMQDCVQTAHIYKKLSLDKYREIIIASLQEKHSEVCRRKIYTSFGAQITLDEKLISLVLLVLNGCAPNNTQIVKFENGVFDVTCAELLEVRDKLIEHLNFVNYNYRQNLNNILNCNDYEELSKINISYE